MGKIYTRFQTKKAQTPYLLGLPPGGTGHQISLIKSTFEFFCAKQILMVCTSCKTLYNIPSHNDVINRGLSHFVFINGNWSLISCRGRGECKRESLQILDLQRLASMHNCHYLICIQWVFRKYVRLSHQSVHLNTALSAFTNTIFFLSSLLVCTRHKI